MAKKKLYDSGLVYSTDPALKIQAEEKNEELTLLTNEQRLVVKLDTRNRGGKVVTLVEGFKGNAADLDALGKQLKSYCGTGGSAKNNEVLIQGDNRKKILLWLHENGYSKAKGK